MLQRHPFSRRCSHLQSSRQHGSYTEPLEDRRLFAAVAADLDVRLIGITGNQQNADFRDETLYDISYAGDGIHPSAPFLDGFEAIPDQPPVTLTPGAPQGATQGGGSLRVSVPQGQNQFWGVRSGNVVDALKAGATKLTYDLTLIGQELNGGSFSGEDNSFNGFAQSNELAVVIAAPGGFIQRNFSAGGATDSLNQDAAWNGLDGARTISWDLTRFTSNGMSLADFITANNATEARFWFTTQGADSNGNQGPMRFYFDNVVLTAPTGDTSLADFESLIASPLIQLPTVPDTDSIGFNPESGLLHRVSGAESYRNDPTRVGYRDNQFMETVDVFSPDLTQKGVFNANAEEYGLPAPRPTFVEPTERRTDAQTDPSFRVRGPNEYHALRDLTWSASEHLFYGADETGLYRLTADGQSTFVASPAGLAGGLKGLTFFTIDGERRLLAAERDGPNIYTLDPQTGDIVGDPITLTDEAGNNLPGTLSLVEHPDGTRLLGLVKSFADPQNAFARQLVQIDPATGVTTLLGSFDVHMADLAFVFQAKAPAPTVTDVFVSGSTWTKTFKNFLQSSGQGDAQFGFRVGEGQAALDELPWANINQISIRFSGPVAAEQADLQVHGVSVGDYAISGFQYDNGTQTATWTLGTPIRADRLTLSLDGDGSGVTGPSGTPLDGEYNSAAADGLPSGDGNAGGDFVFPLNVLSADVDRSGGAVSATDLVLTRNRIGRTTATPGTGNTAYTIFNDVNGDASINATDLVIVRNRIGSSLPLQQTLFSGDRIATKRRDELDLDALLA